MSNDPQVLESPEDVLSTLHSDGSRRWLYPVPATGKFWKWRLIVAWALMIVFIGLPWVKVDSKPAVFLDLMSREFTFFGLTLYATDTFLLTLTLLASFVAIVFITAVFGRVWCGWGCPQTVYLEFVFRPIERLIEGKESVRRRRDEGPTNFDVVWRKTLKFAIYSVLSLFLAHTFVAYFVSWDQLLEWITGPPAENWGFFVMMAVTSGLILFDFGYFREQMCTIACPYARIQSVLQDRDSMIVSYDPGRGEPRGRRSRAQRKEEKDGVEINLGDCIDCYACVRTCPTGIDIRDGLQMECVGCTQCMDACDSIMDSIGKPLGLIRYTSENALEGKESSVFRGRTLLYSVVLVALVSSLVYLFSTRTEVDVNVARVVGAPYSTLGEDKVLNRLRFRVQNRTPQSASFSIEAVEPAGAEVKMGGLQRLEVGPGKTERIETFVVAPEDAFSSGEAQGRFRITDGEDLERVVDFTLLGP